MLVRRRNARLSVRSSQHDATATRALTRQRFHGWSIEIERELEHEVEEGAHVLFGQGRTLWCELMVTGETRDAVLARVRRRQFPGTLAVFEEVDRSVVKIAVYLQRADASETAWGLLAFTIVDGEFALTSFYFDDCADVAWALRCWRSVRHECHLH